ncbi:MAG: flagellar hook protein FlgE [Pseudomonas sp.]
MSFSIGLSGLYAANKSLDVTGNNIANVATTGFKSSRTEFQDQYAASIRGTSGTTNVGSGVKVAAVSQQFTQGTMATGTNRSLDLAIQGNGFFMVSKNGEQLYTRAGAFHTDSQGYIVDNDGNNLQGYSVDSNGNIATGSLTNLRIDSSNQPAKPTTQTTMAANLNSSDAVVTVTPFDPTNTDSYKTTWNTDFIDSQGNKHEMNQYYAKTSTNTWQLYTLVDGRNAADPTSTTPDSTTLTFNSDGSLNTGALTSSGNIAVNADGTLTLKNWVPAAQVGTTTTWTPNGAIANAGGIKLDMLKLTQTNAADGPITNTPDGYPAGQLADMSVDASGNLFATYTFGPSRSLGMVSLTNFSNVQGLIPVGGTMWKQSYASGAPVTGAPETGTLGAINGDTLENSNVDLTGELVNLIQEQSNYQANAKTISTQSTIMQTLIQMT